MQKLNEGEPYSTIFGRCREAPGARYRQGGKLYDGSKNLIAAASGQQARKPLEPNAEQQSQLDAKLKAEAAAQNEADAKLKADEQAQAEAANAGGPNEAKPEAKVEVQAEVKPTKPAAKGKVK